MKNASIIEDTFDLVSLKNRKYEYTFFQITEDEYKGEALDDSSDYLTRLFKAVPRDDIDGKIFTDWVKLVLPNKTIFTLLYFDGDIEGWRKAFNIAVERFNITLANIEDEKLVLSTGESFDLNDCSTEYNSFDPETGPSHGFNCFCQLCIEG